MSNHTPGPWSAHNCAVHPTKNDAGTRFWDVCAGEVYKSPCPRHVSGYIACPENGVAQVFGERAEANARLIAAAPDLLEALQKVVSCFDIKDGLSVRDEQAIKHAASVIYKATGEQA